MSKRLAVLAAWMVLAAGAGAAPAYRAVSGDRVIEITAPRPDIVRVRIGRGALAEDASWAVTADRRDAHTEITVTEAAEVATLTTPALRLQLDRRTLALRIADAAGRELLDDVADAPLEFHGRQFSLRKVMPADAHYFGLGDKSGPLDRRDQAYTLWNSDTFLFQRGTDPLYKSIPFVLGAREDGRAFGLFMDNTWRSFFDFGKAERNTLAFGAEDGAIDYYVIAGPAPKDVVRAYAWLTGTAPLPPRWALGFQQSRYSYGTAAEVRRIAAGLRDHRIPADAIYLDIGYQDRNRPFTVDRSAFPDLPRLVAELGAQGLRLVLITDLHIAHAPGQGYAPYDSGEAADAFVKRPDGSEFVGKVWPGPSVFPDFSRGAVRDWWGRQYAEFARIGVAGFWNDMNEPSVFDGPGSTLPLDLVHRIDEPGFAPRTATHAEMHNVYGMLNSRATFEGLLKLRPDERPFVLTRASYAGGQRWAATWTGDNSSSWDQLNLATSMLVNLGLSGFAYAGDDIGGFAGAQPSSELLTRWFEVGAFQPIFRDHADNAKPPQEPWVGPTRDLEIRRRYVEARYRLLPYLYALADEASRSGLPIVRPVFLEFPRQVAAAAKRDQGVRDQFMLGPDLLVAPATFGESPAPYTVQLPGPGWTDYWSGARVAGNRVVETPTLERLPVYVRPGAIIPRQPLVQSSGQTPSGPLEIAVYPGPDCAGTLYDDDGASLAYRRGDYLRQRLRCTAAPDALTLDFEAREGTHRPWWRRVEVVIHGWSGGVPRATLDGRAVDARFDAATQTLTLAMPDPGGPARLVVAGGR
ncbi:MAG: glycoside hydrolase family 31 protein [Burkholderiales bacterium]|nr:glycoside hydrolase family 31 protein [Burkholderiales bacterium]